MAKSTKTKRREIQRKYPLSELMEKFKNTCVHCNGEVIEYDGNDGVLPDNAATRDHHIPLSKGGSNGKENIVLSCYKCNNKKGDLNPASKERKTLITKWKQTTKHNEECTKTIKEYQEELRIKRMMQLIEDGE